MIIFKRGNSIYFLSGCNRSMEKFSILITIFLTVCLFPLTHVCIILTKQLSDTLSHGHHIMLIILGRIISKAIQVSTTIFKSNLQLITIIIVSQRYVICRMAGKYRMFSVHLPTIIYHIIKSWL
jgi:hypothetical protein